jgi:uncharacterized protein YjbI with pentapeptide repeats
MEAAMADAEQVQLLRRGATAWNEWRRRHSEAKPELAGAQLRGLDLSSADLSGADLRRADLRGAILRDARLTQARLDEANLFKAVLERADLDGAVLLDAQFLNCAQLVAARNWTGAYRDPSLACGAAIPARVEGRQDT